MSSHRGPPACRPSPATQQSNWLSPCERNKAQELGIFPRTSALLATRHGAATPNQMAYGRLLAGGSRVEIAVAGMQIAQVGGLLGVAHVDAVQQDVGAGATEGLALPYRLPGKTTEPAI